MSGLLNVLELAREFKINKIFWPSSIAVFGPDSPKKIHLKMLLKTQPPFMVFQN
jgi:nucleoside-diphosphate-sugar epimerase